ncbi:putative Zn finger protein [Trichococcus patagoniensis]|uniref:Putative Zn finger protein n=1 Tax=Trichococcus patagoniensis TaxID=382641 RepID=A0A2T5IM91_9LACT|nr:hypothetical protein [Trichococcus patagoniensis]PTQ84946.1 putative Zn finger protein [Trichococcus patagoniensis]
MNIKNFQEYINQTILNRGYNYYISGNVDKDYVRRGNTYLFQVEGSENYEVTVDIDDTGEIIHSYCDCPYDLGPVCKHEAAVYFQLAEIINNGNVNGDTKEAPTKQPGIEEVLSTLPKEELIKIIMAISSKDATLEKSLTVRYSKGDREEELAKCAKFMQAVVRKYAGRGGFIEYGAVSAFADEMGSLLEKARNTADSLLALEIIILLLHEAVEAYQYADDSYGDIGGLISECFDVMEDLILGEKFSDSELKQNLFNRLLEDSDEDVYADWEEYKIDLLRLCAEVAETEGLRLLLKNRIMTYLNNNSADDNRSYYTAPLLHILHRLIVVYGTDAEALRFEEENSGYASFRELLIERAIKENNFEKVIVLATDGEKQDNEHAGRRSKWKEIRYDAYKKLSMKAEQARLAKELLFEGNFGYYQELKALNTEDEITFYNKLKTSLKNDQRWQAKNIYVNLIEYEKDSEEIMAYVRENPEYIVKYADILKGNYTEEVAILYGNHIRTAAKSSTKRSAYQDICSLIRRYQNIAGKDSAAELMNELLVLNKRRPAFVDELGKINFG